MRSKSQYRLTATMGTDSAATAQRDADVRRSSTSSGKSTAMIASCVISMPTLNQERQEQLPRPALVDVQRTREAQSVYQAEGEAWRGGRVSAGFAPTATDVAFGSP
jgi:hypothetical protein